MKLERKILPFERAELGEGGAFAGYANAFHLLDVVGDILVPGAFSEGLVEFLESGFVGGINHNWDHPIGRPTEVFEDRKGLWVQARVSDTEAGREALTLLRDGVLTKLSIGFETMEARRLETAAQVAGYWRLAGYSPTAEEQGRAKRGARLILRARLLEVSPVTVPANALATVESVKSVSEGDSEAQGLYGRFLLGEARRLGARFLERSEV